MKKILAILITGITAGAAWCCVSPSNIEGVAFTSGETINLTKLTSLGTNGTNFERDSSDYGIVVRYRSHSSEHAMVSVGSKSLWDQRFVKLYGMDIIADAEYLSSQSTFNYPQAVRIELKWLSEQGIINIDSQTIATISDSLDNTDRGGVRYWTLQERVLGYNLWYTQDSITGSWTNNISGVKAARCGGNAEYTAFPQSLGSVPISRQPLQSTTPFRITRNAAISLTITPWNSVENISLVNASGKSCSVQTKSVSGGIMVSFNNQVTPGVYFLKLGQNASVQTIPVLIGR